MIRHQVGISIIIIGVAVVLMVVTTPTLENHQAIAVSKPMVKIPRLPWHPRIEHMALHSTSIVHHP